MPNHPIKPDDIGLRGNEKSAAQVLAQLVRDYHQADQPGPFQDTGIAAERLRAIQLAGAVAALHGGLKGQQYLFNEVEAVDARAAQSLSILWDWVGEWLS